jgi:Arylsulfatase regulator (Fe-S oxidoreductase)
MNDLTEIHAGNSKYLYSRQYDCMTYISSNNKYKNCLDDDRDINVKKHNNRNNAKLANINIYKALLNPNQIVFEVTERCNLSCVYCAYGKMYTLGKSRNEYNMKWETAKVVLDHYINIWKKIFPHNLRQKCNIGFYGGEALLGIDLIKKIISYIENNAPKNINITYSMTTNGVLLLKTR